MKKDSKTTQPDALEKIFCEPFEKLQRHQMNEEAGNLLMKLILTPKGLMTMPDKLKPFLLKLIEKRIEHCFDYKVDDDRLLLFLTYLSETPGKAVMYMTYLQYWCKKNNVGTLGLQVFCQKIFPHGFPSDSDLGKLWDQQKVTQSPDNLLDYSEAMQSIRFK